MIRLLPVVLGVNVGPGVSRARVPQPLLSRLDPSGLTIDNLRNRPPEDMCRRSLDDTLGIDHAEILLYDQMSARSCEVSG